MNYSRRLLLAWISVLVIGCQHEMPPIAEEPEKPVMTSFSVGNIPFKIGNDSIIGHSDEMIGSKDLVPVFTANGKVTVDSVEQASGLSLQDFTLPRKYKVTGADGSTKSYFVRLTTFTGLPRVYITTDDGQNVVSLDLYKKGTFLIEPNATEGASVPLTRVSIRGRGNSTWGMAKKPYKIKFDAPLSLFGAQPSKEWVLLANYADKTLIRNFLALNLSSRMEMAFTPMARFVELYINGRHDGNYLVSDQVEVSPSRVNVETHSGEDDEHHPEMITGGYLLEIDKRVRETQEDPYFESTCFPIVVKYPKDVQAAPMSYIKNYVLEAENALFGSLYTDPVNGFRKYFDEDSFIKWFIINEIFKNVDSQQFSSIYFYKPRDGKIHFGPVWDFDLGAGNATHAPTCLVPTGYYTLYHKWFTRMYQDPAFKTKVKDTWKKYRTPVFDQLVLLEEQGRALDKSQRANFLLWPLFSDPDWAVVQGKASYAEHFEWLKSFLTQRINWMDSEFK